MGCLCLMNQESTWMSHYNMLQKLKNPLVEETVEGEEIQIIINQLKE